MRPVPPWVDGENSALLTDLYQLTMLQAYWSEGMREPAVFDLCFRRLPAARNYLLACGLEDALAYLEGVRFHRDALEYLDGLGLFRDAFLDFLAGFRFTGDVYAMPEGTPVFGDEPLLEVVAPIVEAQLVETFLMNQIHLQTVLASKAVRVVAAAQGRRVVDFALRRMHGTDAAVKGARTFHIAGVDATSNVLAGRIYGIPVSGTLAHSYVQAHESELDSYRAFARLYPQTFLLVDSYDTIEGVRNVIALAAELGDAFSIRGIRIDSGDLGALAFEARGMLDAAGLHDVGIFASGLLDEYRIAELVRDRAPINGFGVGTRMGVSFDAPAGDIVYKLVEYGGRGRLKLSPDKPSLPGRKQVFRVEDGGVAIRDVLGLHDESLEGRRLLEPVMRGGKRLTGTERTLGAIRAHAAREIERLPGRLRALEVADPPYSVEHSDALRDATAREADRARTVPDGARA